MPPSPISKQMRYLPEISWPMRSTLGAAVELGVAAVMTAGQF
jgi:hypothetical protein